MTISLVRDASSTPVVAGVAESLARLNDLTLDELRAEWRRLYRSSPPRLSRDLMRRAIAYLMLQNRIYRGEIVHKDKSYPGLHEAIVDQKLWDEVQAVLALPLQPARTHRRPGRLRAPARRGPTDDHL